MIFSSITFLFLFFPMVFIGYAIMPNIKMKNLFLTGASLLFYAWGEPIFVFVMLISVFINWQIGLMIEKSENKKSKLLSYAVVINIGMLFYFKYITFFIEVLNSVLTGLNYEMKEITLPIGISFFTFQALSYVIDVKRGETKAQKNYLDLLLYISLFPQLIAGPIVKYRDVEAQLRERNIDLDKVSKGLRKFIIGLSKKILIANQMAIIVDAIFAMEVASLNSLTTWIGAIAYTFQIYFDFSGYSDMAIGLGAMFGFDFKENFNYPLTATSIKDFWRRWHISLSTWFREYLYIPLGGNRKGRTRTYINQFIVFFATGLWHGANYTFIMWGLVHGLFLVLETKGVIPVDKVKYNWLKRGYTYVVVCVLFVIFRVDTLTYGLAYVGEMFLGFDFSIMQQAEVLSMLTPFVCCITIMAIICSTNILRKIQVKLSTDGKLLLIPTNIWEVSTYLVVILLLVMDIMFLASNAYNPFIYFRF